MVPDSPSVTAHTPLCLTSERRSVVGAVSVPLEVDLHTVSERLCDITAWPDLAWFVDSTQPEASVSNFTNVTLTAGGRTADVRVAVECAPNALLVQVYRSRDTPVAELRWVPVDDKAPPRLEGRLRVESPVPLPPSVRRLVAQRLLVGPTRSLAGSTSTASLFLPDPSTLENP